MNLAHLAGKVVVCAIGAHARPFRKRIGDVSITHLIHD